MPIRLRSSTRGAAASADESIMASTTATPRRSEKKSALSAPYDKPIVGEDLAKYTKLASIATVSAILFLVGVYMLIQQDYLKLHPKNISPETFKGYASKAEYALRYQVLLITWLVINVLLVIYVRLTRKAINPLTEATEHAALGAKYILTNSFEQIFISLFAQLIFISFADNTTVLKFIPAINIVQFIGRVSFFAGYPIYRAFGFDLTVFPNIVLVLYNLYRFGNFVNLY